MSTHESYVQSVKQLAIDKLLAAGKLDEAERVRKTKLVYGLGKASLRGVTHYGKWNHQDCDCDLAEICAFGEHSDIQLAGTTLHELGHVVAGAGTGHGKEWKAACKLLGLRKVKAAGTQYLPAVFDQDMRFALAALTPPQDGKPATREQIAAMNMKRLGCTLGIGVRGGISRGTGSGSRMRKYECNCGVIIRAARDDLDATCNLCNSSFKRS